MTASLSGMANALYVNITALAKARNTIRSAAVAGLIVGVALSSGDAAPTVAQKLFDSARSAIPLVHTALWNGVVIIALSLSLYLRLRAGALAFLLYVFGAVFLFPYVWARSFFTTLSFAAVSLWWCAASMDVLRLPGLTEAARQAGALPRGGPKRMGTASTHYNFFNASSLAFLSLTAASFGAIYTPLVRDIEAGAVRDGLTLIFVGAGFASWEMARRHAMRRASLMSQAPADAFLFLRSFEDDMIEWSDAQSFSKRRPRFEAIVEATLRPFGALVALGRPGERLPQLGASKEYVGGDWKQYVAARIREATLVHLVAGTSRSLLWELSRVAESGALRKLVLLVPPLASKHDIPARWGQFLAAATQHDGLRALVDVRLDQALLVWFRDPSHPLVVTADERKVSRYREALDVPFPRAENGLVEVVDVEHRFAVRSRVGAKVVYVSVPQDLDLDPGVREPRHVGGHDAGGAAKESEGGGGHSPPPNPKKLRQAVMALPLKKRDRIRPVSVRAQQCGERAYVGCTHSYLQEGSETQARRLGTLPRSGR